MRWITGKRRRSLLLAIAAAAVAAGVIVAIASARNSPRHANTPRARLERSRARHHAAAHGHGHGRSARAIAAGYLGLTRAQLRAKLRSGQTLAQIASATVGKSATGLIEVLVNASQQERMASARSRITLAVDGVRLSTGRSAATYLGVSAAKLHQELHSGKSLAQIAAATSGKSVTGLVNALVAAKEAEVKAARASGALAGATADKYLANVRRHVARQVQHAPRSASR